VFFLTVRSTRLAEWLVCALLGSLFPDIDIKSKGQKIFYGALFMLAFVLLIKKQWRILAYVGIVSIIPLLVEHRGLFHRWWFLIILVVSGAYGMIMLYPHEAQRIWYDAGFFLLGIASHLYLDMGFRKMFRMR
jgi:hypothetical protein